MDMELARSNHRNDGWREIVSHVPIAGGTAGVHDQGQVPRSRKNGGWHARIIHGQPDGKCIQCLETEPASDGFRYHLQALSLSSEVYRTHQRRIDVFSG